MTCSRLIAVAAALIIPAAAMAETIEGEVDYTGKPPTPGKLHREADPFCAKKTMTDPAVLVKNGKLENVWTIAVVGQKIEAKNGDPVLHNVHTYLGSTTLFNKGMPNDKAAPIEYVAKEEGMMKWKCDVHPWMRGFIGVSKSGLQAVTKGDGTFKIDNVPPGKYTVESWHEKYGTKTQEVTVEAGKPAKINFKYDGTEKGGA